MKKIACVFIIFVTVLLTTNSCYRILNRVVGHGNSFETELDININRVKEVNVNGSIDVEIFYSEIPGVVVTAQENITDLISVKVVGDVAKIDYKSNVNVKPTDVTKVTLYMEDIQNVTVNGSGDVFYGGGFPVLQKLELKTDGSGDIIAHDIACDKLTIDIQGSGEMDIENVRCYELFTTVRGSGDVEVEYIDCAKINTFIKGSGDVKYNGYCDDHIIRVQGSGNLEAYNLNTIFTQVDVMGSGNSYIWVNERLNVYINGSGNVYYRGEPFVNVDQHGSGRVIQRH